MDYKIISDGCCDLEKEIIEQYNLRIIPFFHLYRIILTFLRNM